MYEDLKPTETELIGSWIEVDDKVIGDENCLRIKFLVDNRLEKMGKDWSGWETLYETQRMAVYGNILIPIAVGMEEVLPQYFTYQTK